MRAIYQHIEEEKVVSSMSQIPGVIPPLHLPPLPPQPILHALVLIQIRLRPPLLVHADQALRKVVLRLTPNVPLVIDLAPRHWAVPAVHVVEQILFGYFGSKKSVMLSRLR
ncbi:hypothetical protein PMIN04_003619 [Paraphaeosphaeria minitans]